MHAEAFRLRSLDKITEPWFRRPPAVGDGLGGGMGPGALGPGDAGAAAGVDGRVAAAPVEGNDDAAAEDSHRLRAKIRELKDRIKRQAGLDVQGRLAYNAGEEARRRERRREKEKEKKKRKRRRRDRGESSGSSSSSTTESLFQVAPSRSANGIRAMAEEHPGTLYQNGLEEITRVMGLREGATDGDSRNVKLVGYLQAILLGKHSLEKVGPKSARELRTLAEALDHLAQGRLPQVADLLMQRFKALEQSISDGHWGLASQMELVEEGGKTLASAKEQRTAARAELLRHKLEEARKRHGGNTRR